MKTRNIFAFIVCAAFSVVAMSCSDNAGDLTGQTDTPENPDTGTPDVPEPEETFDVTYEESMEDFANPERGFYKYTEVGFRGGSVHNPISVPSLSAYRETGKTLIYQYNYLTDFMDGDISEEALDVIRQNMQALSDKAAIKKRMDSDFPYALLLCLCDHCLEVIDMRVDIAI